ncbi:hypothetical protein SEA_PEANAM_89 [Mycobacterium phage Peanam]|nr:hypothetical protein SEA_PEANAM_89 [Mycobacterium phage Peanam]
MGSAAVLFLDGPLAGRTRDVETWRGNVVPPEVFYAVRPRSTFAAMFGDDPHDALVQHETVTYRLKPNRLPYGPRWAYAIGERVGEQMVTVVPYVPEARDAVGAEFDEYVSRHAHEAMARHAASVDLIAMHVHEVWRGTRAEAAEQMTREGKPVPGVATLATPGVVDTMLASTVFVVHEGVAMPKEGSAWAA